MLYNLLVPLADQYAILNVFRYLTFRSGAAVLTALIICFVIGRPIIAWLKRKQKEGQPIRDDGPDSHIVKKGGTPTMGGVMILFSVIFSTFLWADLSNKYVWVVLFVTAGFGFLGFIDDYKKLIKRTHHGVSGKIKLLWQVTVSVVAYFFIAGIAPAELDNHLAIPFMKNIFLDLGWFYLVFTVVVIVGASNAVNLTDGLDGLAIVPVMIAAGCFALITYLAGNAVFASYLQIHAVPGSGEIAVICSAMVGASLGFLWFNAPPAQIFMGDTGSLSLGGMLGTISVITKHELVLAIIGGLFVVETLSVMIQVWYFKRTGKRIFLMAPIHHHFEEKGWSEPTIVIRFWIIAVIFALIGLSTLKLR